MFYAYKDTEVEFKRMEETNTKRNMHHKILMHRRMNVKKREGEGRHGRVKRH